MWLNFSALTDLRANLDLSMILITANFNLSGVAEKFAE